MPKKRRSSGRSKGGKGRAGAVQCSQCGKRVPRDKAKRVTKPVSLVGYQIAKELRSQGAIIPRQRVTKYYCVSCAVHRGVVTIRSKSRRRPTREF
jgi:small subunit ribosomal protein S26e